MEFSKLFSIEQHSKLSIEDVERNANLFAKSFGEQSREEDLSKLFDEYHKSHYKLVLPAVWLER